MRYIVSAICLAIATIAPSAMAQIPQAEIASASLADLPNDLMAAIQQRDVIQILAVNGTEVVDGQILSVNELIVQPGGTIEFANMDYPWIAIMADRMRIVDPLASTTIRRNLEIVPQHGANGAKGANGSQGRNGGNGHRTGDRGGNGAIGGNGVPGQTKKIPTLYLIAGSVENARTGQALQSLDIAYNFPGIDGGNGGNGGNGGVGGGGGRGQNGSAGFPQGCRRGPGGGGNGGNGGAGGNGASNAPGSDGAKLVFISTRQGVDALSLGNIQNIGGKSGKPGAAGKAGRGGGLGGSCAYPAPCSRNSSGADGRRGRDGSPGVAIQADGKRGKVEAIILDDIATLFDS
jgi:hypothetical protein